METTRESVELDISGMTCASCAARVEKKLNKIDGVQASVNYATERAKVLFPIGMRVEDLIKVVEQTGYGAKLPVPDEPVIDRVAILRTKVVVSGLFAVPVIALAMIPGLQFPGWQWLSLVLTVPVYLWGGWQFHASAIVNLRHRATTMDTLISLGTTAAMAWSLYALFFGPAGRIGYTHPFEFVLMRSDSPNIYFEATVGIIWFLLLGRSIEARSRKQAGDAVRALLTLGVTEVTLLRNGVERRIPIQLLGVGDEFVVRPGEKIATDGVVVQGFSAIDASMVTGESVPVDVAPGDDVIGACVNTNGRLVVRATRVGKDTHLAQLARMVEEAQTGKAQVQRLADRVSDIFVPVVLVVAVLTGLVWLVLGEGVAFALTTTVSVLIIACPCALGLATPMALLVGTGRGAQLGIVIKGPEVLESTHAVDTIVLDKTGTVTTGTMAVASVVAVDGTDEAALLRIAGAAESGSEHPVARAIAAHAASASSVDHFENVPGQGVRAEVDGHRVLMGKPSLVGIDLGRAGSVAMSAEVGPVLAAYDAAQALGQTAVLVAWDGRLRGMIAVADQIKDTSAAAVAQFRALGLRPILLTGDHAAVAQTVATAVGITDVIADVLPADKVSVIKRLQAEGRRVAMVGDGVNDSAAIAQADLGIAMGTGTDAAIEAGDLTLMRGDLRVAADAIRLSRATLRTIKANLFWAFAYNVAAIPLAALGFLNPMIAGGAMAFSSVFVVLNSVRLRAFRPAAG